MVGRGYPLEEYKVVPSLVRRTICCTKFTSYQVTSAKGVQQEIMSYPVPDPIDQALLDCMVLRGLSRVMDSHQEGKQKGLTNQVSVLVDRALSAIPILQPN